MRNGVQVFKGIRCVVLGQSANQSILIFQNTFAVYFIVGLHIVAQGNVVFLVPSQAVEFVRSVQRLGADFEVLWRIARSDLNALQAGFGRIVEEKVVVIDILDAVGVDAVRDILIDIVTLVHAVGDEFSIAEDVAIGHAKRKRYIANDVESNALLGLCPWINHGLPPRSLGIDASLARSGFAQSSDGNHMHIVAQRAFERCHKPIGVIWFQFHPHSHMFQMGQGVKNRPTDIREIVLAGAVDVSPFIAVIPTRIKTIDAIPTAYRTSSIQRVAVINGKVGSRNG